MKMFTLDHVYCEALGSEEKVKRIGIFSSEDLAQKAINVLVAKPGFCDYPDGFEINEIVVDRIGWIEGFVDLSGEW